MGHGACLEDDVALGFAEGTLEDPRARDEAERHLDTCTACRTLVGALARGAGGTTGGAEIRESRTNDGSATDERFAILAKGVVIGRFVVLGPIGFGGMGAVYAAYDPQLDRKVALKLLHTRIDADGAARDRLLEEGKAMAQVTHPNVVSVHDVGTYEDTVWMAMEFVDGENFRFWMRRSERSVREIVEVLVDGGRGLAAAHARGLVHHDFKPDNLVIAADGRAKVTDFGLARGAETLSERREVSGTPAYMSPEQRRGDPVDARSDQYSFGVTMFEALYGELPSADGPLDVSKPRRGVSSVHRRVLARALAKNPDDRFPSMSALLDELVQAPRRRRRRVVVGVVLATSLAAIGGLIVEARMERPRVCSDSEARASAVWSPSTKAHVRDRFLATQSPFAEGVLAGTERIIDAYTRRWVVDDRAACVATKVDRTQSAEVHALRSACLTRRLAELSALVEVLGNADATTVEQAANAVGKLTPLDACTDNAALLVQPLPPSAPDVRAKVEAIRLDLVRVKALLDSAKYKEGMELVDARVADAEHAGYPPVRAEALFYRGALRDAVSDFPGAEEDLLRAADDAETSRHDELAARARTLLVWVIGYRQAKYEVGDALAHTARAAVKRAGARPDLAARLASDLGTLLWAEGKFRPARESYDEARVLWERAFGPEHPLVATAVNNVALALWSDGRLEEALEMHERALSLRTKLLGPAHPQVGTSQNNIGIVLLDLCRFAEARERHRRAIDIVSRAYGEKHPIVAGLQNNLGLAELELGESASAVRVLEHALATRKETLRADHPDIAGSLVNLAYADLVLENPDRARSRAEDALARLRTAFGPANPKLVDALVVHAKALRALRRPAEALVSARSAVDIATPALGARHAHYAASYVTLGGCLLDLRRAAEAVPAFTEVLSRADAFHDALVVGEAALGRARARRVIDPRADTREDLELARAKLTASGPRGAKLLRDLEGVPKD